MENAQIMPEVPALSIQDSNQVVVFKIETNGRILWRPQGSTELEVMDVENDLSIAFALCVEMMAGMGHKALLHDIRGKAVKDKAQAIAEGVAQYLVDIKHIKEEHKDIHIKNVTTIVNGI